MELFLRSKAELKDLEHSQPVHTEENKRACLGHNRRGVAIWPDNPVIRRFHELAVQTEARTYMQSKTMDKGHSEIIRAAPFHQRPPSARTPASTGHCRDVPRGQCPAEPWGRGSAPHCPITPYCRALILALGSIGQEAQAQRQILVMDPQQLLDLWARLHIVPRMSQCIHLAPQLTHFRLQILYWAILLQKETCNQEIQTFQYQPPATHTQGSKPFIYKKVVRHLHSSAGMALKLTVPRSGRYSALALV